MKASKPLACWKKVSYSMSFKTACNRDQKKFRCLEKNIQKTMETFLQMHFHYSAMAPAPHHGAAAHLAHAEPLLPGTLSFKIKQPKWQQAWEHSGRKGSAEF